MAKTNTKLPKQPDLKALNWYWLQKEMYASWAIFDTPGAKEEGRKRIKAVYAEYARRGVQNVLLPDPVKQ
jgi:hypothetical protein